MGQVQVESGSGTRYWRIHPRNSRLRCFAGGYYRAGELIFCGKIRNGFKDAGSKERVYRRFNGLGTSKCPFDNLPEPANARRGLALTAEAMKLCCWLKPRLVAQIGIRERTPDGHLRHSTFLGLREDKDARDVVREHAER